MMISDADKGQGRNIGGDRRNIYVLMVWDQRFSMILLCWGRFERVIELLQTEDDIDISADEAELLWTK